MIQVQVIGADTAERQLRDGANRVRQETNRSARMAAEKVADEGRAKVERRTGRAAGSVQVVVNGEESTVTAGQGVPYWHFMRFGGAVGRHKSVRRPVVPEGRYFPTRIAIERRVVAEVESGVERAVRGAGL